jgi:hypothetical protein
LIPKIQVRQNINSNSPLENICFIGTAINDSPVAERSPRKKSKSPSSVSLLKLEPPREHQEDEGKTIIQAIIRGNLSRKINGVDSDEFGNVRSVSPSVCDSNSDSNLDELPNVTKTQTESFDFPLIDEELTLRSPSG